MERPDSVGRPGDKNTKRWRASPKLQIMLVTVCFFVLNLVLIAVWAWALIGRD